VALRALMNTPVKWLTKEERKDYEDRVLKMRDKDGLIFRIIAERLGISIVRASNYYKNAKGRKGE